MRREVIGAALVVLSRLAIIPRTPWRPDELSIMAAVQGIVPEPRYPLYVGFGKVAYFLMGDPFLSLMVINLLATAGTFITLYLALRALLDDADVAAGAALLFSLGAGFVVQSSSAMPEALAMFFVASAFYAFAHDRDLSFGVCASLAVGCVPELAVAMIVALAVAAAMRKRVVPLAVFAVVTLLWGMAWLETGGGFAAPHIHLAGLRQALPRFAFHPWGGKLVTAPLLLCALAGVYALARRFDRKLLPLTTFAAAHLAVTMLTADPQLGVRSAVASMLLVALLVPFGLSLVRKPIVTVAGAAALGLLSFAYVWPLVHEHATRPSSLTAAAALAGRTLADGTVVAYHGESAGTVNALLSRFDRMPIDEALRRLTERPDVNVVALYAGISNEPEATVFPATDDDVHRKMLGVVPCSATLDPVRPRERYTPQRNAFDFERTAAGPPWRWLGPDATLRLPPNHHRSGTVTLRVFENAPFDSTLVTIGSSEFTVTRQAVAYRVDATRDLTIRSTKSFVPANVNASADRRLLAVQLLDLEF